MQYPKYKHEHLGKFAEVFFFSFFWRFLILVPLFCHFIVQSERGSRESFSYLMSIRACWCTKLSAVRTLPNSPNFQHLITLPNLNPFFSKSLISLYEFHTMPFHWRQKHCNWNTSKGSHNTFVTLIVLH